MMGAKVNLLIFVLPLLTTARVAADTGLTLTVHASVFRTRSGGLVCRLFTNGDGFPAKATHQAEHKASIPGTEAACEFRDLHPGVYAVALFHDENGNGKLDTNFLGLPAEGVGTSNNKRPLVGPPSWSASRFRLERDGDIHVTLHY